MIRHGFTWPEQMKCEKLQHQPLITTVEGERVACVDRPFLDVVTAPRKYFKFTQVIPFQLS